MASYVVSLLISEPIVIFLSALKCLALGLLSLPLGGCAVGVGLIFAALLRAEAYAPELGGLFFIRAMLGFALIETFVIVVVVLVALVFVM